MQTDSYDHHAAIYYLLQERLTHYRHSATGSPSKHQQAHQNQRHHIQEHRRRPSNLAEQVSLTGHYNMHTDNNFQSLRDYSSPRPAIAILPQQQQQHQDQQPTLHTANVVEENQQPISHETSGGMVVSEYKCLTCGGPILENTTSTTTCVKCAGLRTRRRAFAYRWEDPHQQQLLYQQLQHQNSQKQFQHLPLSESIGSERVRVPHDSRDSRDSGVSSGSSQDYGDCTPTTEKSLIFPPRYSIGNRVSIDRQSVQFSQLVRKLSEIEGIVPNIPMKTSIDEGIYVEEPSKQLVDDPAFSDQTQTTTNPEHGFISSGQFPIDDSTPNALTFTAPSHISSLKQPTISAKNQFIVWRPAHQLSQGSTFDSVSLDRSCSIASPSTEQLPHTCPVEHAQDASNYIQTTNQQPSYPSGQSGASCSAFPLGSDTFTRKHYDLTASLPSCTQGSSVHPSSHEANQHTNRGEGNYLNAPNTMGDMEASDTSSPREMNKMAYNMQQQQTLQQYRYIPTYSQHLPHGMKRLIPQSYLQKQNLLGVVNAPHQMLSNLSPRRVRSPISFREGRRASDTYSGTCSPFPNTVAFPQRLYDKSKAQGQFELHEVREEHKALQSQFGSGNKQRLVSVTNSNPNDDTERCETPPDLIEHQSRLSVAKRISLPENFAYSSSTSGLLPSTSTFSNTMAGNININDPNVTSLGFQPQMLPHKMRSATFSNRRNRQGVAGLKSYDSYGFYQAQCHQQGLSADFLFQPIAEDEADGVPLSPHEHPTAETSRDISPSAVVGSDIENTMLIPSCLPLTKMCLPVNKNDKHTVTSMDQDAQEPNWQTLSNDMRISCRLTESTTKESGPNFVDNEEPNSSLNKPSAAIISSETVDQQYSQDQINLVERFSTETENMDISNTEKYDQTGL